MQLSLSEFFKDKVLKDWLKTGKIRMGLDYYALLLDVFIIQGHIISPYFHNIITIKTTLMLLEGDQVFMTAQCFRASSIASHDQS